MLELKLTRGNKMTYGKILIPVFFRFAPVFWIHTPVRLSDCSEQQTCVVSSLRGVEMLVEVFSCSWWRHQMETFSTLLALCVGNSPVPGEFPSQRPVTRSFDVFFNLCLDKRLSKQSWGWWFETPSRSLSRHCNAMGQVTRQPLVELLS